MIYGVIKYEYNDPVNSANPGNPAELLDDIITGIFWEVERGREPSDKMLNDTITRLRAFEEKYKVVRVQQVINDLVEYMENR